MRIGGKQKRHTPTHPKPTESILISPKPTLSYPMQPDIAELKNLDICTKLPANGALPNFRDSAGVGRRCSKTFFDSYRTPCHLLEAKGLATMWSFYYRLRELQHNLPPCLITEVVPASISLRWYSGGIIRASNFFNSANLGTLWSLVPWVL